MATAPSAMKMPRKISARMMPTSNACCWYFFGTLKLAMMMMKMNRLSIDRLYSVSQPAKNSNPNWRAWKFHTKMPNAMARPT